MIDDNPDVIRCFTIDELLTFVDTMLIENHHYAEQPLADYLMRAGYMAAVVRTWYDGNEHDDAPPYTLPDFRRAVAALARISSDLVDLPIIVYVQSVIDGE